MLFLRAAMLFLALLPGAAFAAEIGAARISLIKGDVQIYTVDTQDWVAAVINMPLREGDRLWVPLGSRSEIQIQGGVYIRLGASSAFDILALQEESYQFYLNGGHAYINNRKGGIDHIQIDTPQSSIGCYDNSLAMIDVAESGAAELIVLKGYAAAETIQGKTRVEAGNELHIGDDLSAEISPLTPPDEWENWNRARDKKLAAGNRSLRYIPEELDDYASELDNNGKWVFVTDYGYCWTPLKVVADWAPYQDGRWVWVNGDYVWIATEPWGWVSHHYGRWAFVANFGWCWVPPPAGGAFWSPGYVGWVHTPKSVAWVPLAPGEIFYGRGNYGPGSVNITDTAVNQDGIRHYRNVNVQNGVTAVSNTTFISGRKERARGWNNPFKEANISVGQPAIKPNSMTSSPAIRNIPAGKKPPERVKRVSIDEIRRDRAVVRAEHGSVFKPGLPGAAMPVRKLNDLRQNRVRDLQPALQPTKPLKNAQPSARPGQQLPVKQPGINRERLPQTPPLAAPVKQPVTMQPVSVKERPKPPPAIAAPQTLTRPPGKSKSEPRWQEPIPSGKTATGQPVKRPQPSGGKEEEKPGTRPPGKQGE